MKTIMSGDTHSESKWNIDFFFEKAIVVTSQIYGPDFVHALWSEDGKKNVSKLLNFKLRFLPLTLSLYKHLPEIKILEWAHCFS